MLQHDRGPHLGTMSIVGQYLTTAPMHFNRTDEYIRMVQPLVALALAL